MTVPHAVQALLFVVALAFANLSPAPAYAGVAEGVPACDSLPDPLHYDDVARTDRIARAYSTLLRTVGSYDPAAAYKLQCLDQLVALVGSIFSKIETARASFWPTVSAVIAVAAANILAALLNQFINNVVNAVCQAGDQIYNYLQSGIQSAICIPQGRGINPFDFTIDLDAVRCSGWSVDLLTGEIHGNPIQGLDLGDTSSALQNQLKAQKPTSSGVNIYGDANTIKSSPTPVLTNDDGDITTLNEPSSGVFSDIVNDAVSSTSTTSLTTPPPVVGPR